MAQEPNSAAGESQQNLTSSNGRSFQAVNAAYKLPTDSSEHSRLDLQHEVLKLVLGGRNYQTPDLVEAVLSPREDSKPRILDVGAGSGKWAIEMANEFPNADVLGIDLVLPNVLSDSDRSIPPNCTFQVADANHDIQRIELAYDLIQQRCVEPGIHDSDLFFFETARVLRPGGLLLLVGANVQLVDDKGEAIPLQMPGEVGYSHYQHLVSCATEVLLKAGPLRIRHPFWKSMLERNSNYGEIHIQEVLIPTGPWRNNMSETERKLAEIMRDDLLHLTTAIKAILLRDKALSDAFVTNLAENAINEIRGLNPAVHAYLKWMFVTAVRKETPWVARDVPWKEPPDYDVYDYIVRPLPTE